MELILKRIAKRRSYTIGRLAVLKEEKPGIGAQFASPSQRKEGEDADWKLLECR